jgi:hypothetical protein
VSAPAAPPSSEGWGGWGDGKSPDTAAEMPGHNGLPVSSRRCCAKKALGLEPCAAVGPLVIAKL